MFWRLVSTVVRSVVATFRNVCLNANWNYAKLAVWQQFSGMEAQPKEIRYYVTEEDISPFVVWFKSLRDGTARNKIEIRLKRLELGNLGDYKFVGAGVYELRVDTGPGYRIYFGQVGMRLFCYYVAETKVVRLRIFS